MVTSNTTYSNLHHFPNKKLVTSPFKSSRVFRSCMRMSSLIEILSQQSVILVNVSFQVVERANSCPEHTLEVKASG